jgi:SAM-dependent methyltransferase
MPATRNAKARRQKSQFFEKYCRGRGIDIGCGDDWLFPDIDAIDKNPNIPNAIHMDAQYETACLKETYDFVYSSHCLEHMIDPEVALKNWYRILKPGGYLIIVVPHRDYYEKKDQLPSNHNRDHKYFFLPFQAFLPNTLSLYHLLRTLDNTSIVYINECIDHLALSKGGIVCLNDELVEWSIEAVVQKGYYTPIYELGGKG